MVYMILNYHLKQNYWGLIFVKNLLLDNDEADKVEALIVDKHHKGQVAVDLTIQSGCTDKRRVSLHVNV